MDHPQSFRKIIRSGLILGLVAVVGGVLLTHRIQEHARARSALTRFQQATSQWGPDLSFHEYRKRTLDQLRALGREVVPPLIEDLDHDPVFKRWLKRIPFVPPLAVLQDTSFTRFTSAGYLGSLGPLATPAIDSLIRHCSDPHPDVRLACVRALGKIARNNPRSQETLTRLAQGTDTVLAYAAAVALWEMDPGDETARRRVESLVTTSSLQDSSRLLDDLGPAGAIFGGSLRQRIQASPVNQARLAAQVVLWGWTGDTRPLLQDLDALAATLHENPSDPQTASVILHTSNLLDGDPAIRDRMKSMFRTLADHATGIAQSIAINRLQRFQNLDQRQIESVPQPPKPRP